MSAIIACPECEGTRTSSRSKTINLATGKQAPGVLLAYAAILIGFGFGFLGGYWAVNAFIGGYFSGSLLVIGFIFMTAFYLLGWGGNRLAQRKGERAKAYYFRCLDCKHKWMEWELGVKVTRKMG